MYSFSIDQLPFVQWPGSAKQGDLIMLANRARTWEMLLIVLEIDGMRAAFFDMCTHIQLFDCNMIAHVDLVRVLSSMR